MKALKIIIASIFFAILVACEKDQIEGSCIFAPGNSNWPIEEDCITCNWACTDCFVTIRFMDQDYNFNEVQLDREPQSICGESVCEDVSESYQTVFFRLFQALDTADFNQYVGQKMPVRKYDASFAEARGLRSALQLTDYCNRKFDPVEGLSLDESYNMINSVTTVNTIRYLSSDLPVTLTTYNFTGEIKTQFHVNDVLEPFIATYQLRISIERIDE